MASNDEAKEATAVPIMEEEKERGPATIKSAYQDLKNAQTADERSKYFNIIYGMICTSTVVTTFLTLLNFFPLYILIVGAVHVHSCQIQRLIPVYMIVEGVVFLVRTSIFWYFRWRHKKQHPKAPAHQSVAQPALPSFLANAFLFAWLICGSVWLFGNRPDFDDQQSSHYCNKLLYISAFVYVILKWIAFPIGLLIGCCILASAAVAHRTQGKSET